MTERERKMLGFIALLLTHIAEDELTARQWIALRDIAEELGVINMEDFHI